MADKSKAAEAAPAKSICFHYEKSTKGAHRFFECFPEGHAKAGQAIDDGSEQVGQLYVKKLCLGAEPPKMLTMAMTTGAERALVVG